MPRTIRWFDELDSGDTASAGGKGANLGELHAPGFPVPPGLRGDRRRRYLDAMDDGGVRDELRAVFADACADVDDADGARRGCRAAAGAGAQGGHAGRRRGRGRSTPTTGSVRTTPPVARALVGDRRGRGGHLVRRHARDVHQRRRRRGASSSGSSTAGPRCSASGSIAYRASQGSTRNRRSRWSCRCMVDSERAGRACSPPTRRPATAPDRDRGRVRAGRGRRRRPGRARHLRGRQGRTARLLDGRVGAQDAQDRAGGRTATSGATLDADEARRAACSPTTRCSTLARLGLRVEEHYGEPQDIEWAIADGTTVPRAVPARSPPSAAAGLAAPRPSAAAAGRCCVRGLGASPGIARRRGPGPALARGGRAAAATARCSWRR